MYATVGDMGVLYGYHGLVQVATPDHLPPLEDSDLLRVVVEDGDLTNYPSAQVTSARATLTRIEEALTRASRWIDAMLADRYTLPLSAATVESSDLPGICCDMARYHLFSNSELTETIQDRYKRAQDKLNALASGRASLIDGAAATGGAAPDWRAGTSAFDRDAGGY